MPQRFKLRGKDLAGGHVGAYSETRGDWKYLVEMLFLAAHYACTACCHLCRASKKIKRLWFTRFGRRALHRQTRYTNRQYLDWATSRPPGQRGHMHYVEGFDIWRVWVDWMHSSDLGALAVAIPSAMWELTERRCPAWAGNNRKVKMDRAWEDYSDWCRTNHVTSKAARFRKERFTFTQIGKYGFVHFHELISFCMYTFQSYEF